MSRDKRRDTLPEDESNQPDDLPYLEVSRKALSGNVSRNKDIITLKNKKKHKSGSSEPDSLGAVPPLSERRLRASAKKESDKWWWIGGFLIGFIIGLAMSLTYGWVLDPRPVSVKPAHLRAEDKELYLKLIAAAYAHDKNEDWARERLAALEDPDIENTVVNLTEQTINQEGDIRDVLSLVELSRVLGQTTGAMIPFIATPTSEPTVTPTLAPTSTPRPTQTPTPVTPTLTPIPTATDVPTDTPTPLTPIPTNTPSSTPSATPTKTPPPTNTPTRTPTHTPTLTRTPTPSRTPTPPNTPTPGPNAPFGVAQSVVLCESNATSDGLLRIYVRDRLDEGVAGVKITVTWSGGQDSFFTGFKPEIDPGYADFQMESGQRYQVELTDTDFTGEIPEIITDNQTMCPNLPNNIDPSWQVVFKQGAN